MRDVLNMAATFLQDRRGVTAVEYAIVAGVLIVVVISAFNAFGAELSAFIGTLTL